jgi:hypothetical protein
MKTGKPRTERAPRYDSQTKGRNNEDTDINSNIGVTAHGVRPECGATTDAGADERNADDSAGERKENATRAGAGSD